jgi:DNA repair exonuclease SbcCD ATPase subunit
VSSRIRDRIAELRSELDTLDDSLPPEGEPMTDADVRRIETALERLGAKVDGLAEQVGGLRESIAVDRTRAEGTAETARLALQSAQSLADLTRAVQARADEACRAAAEAQARQATLDARLREVEEAERDRVSHRRALAAVTSIGGTAGLGSMLWHLAVSLGWVAG